MQQKDKKKKDTKTKFIDIENKIRKYAVSN